MSPSVCDVLHFKLLFSVSCLVGDNHLGSCLGWATSGGRRRSVIAIGVTEGENELPSLISDVPYYLSSCSTFNLETALLSHLVWPFPFFR